MIRQPYKNLSLEQLGNFCDVIRHGGYAEAARQSGLSAATLWEQVHALERYYGVELFRRQGRTITPTIEAQRLAEMVRPLLAGIESTKDVLLQEGGALPEKVTLVAGARMLMDEVSRALGRFHERFPTIRLEIEHAGSEQL